MDDTWFQRQLSSRENVTNYRRIRLLGVCDTAGNFFRKTMVLILDGNSEYVAHAFSKFLNYRLV